MGPPSAKLNFPEGERVGAGAGIAGPGANGRGVQGLLLEREASHGDFNEMAMVASCLREALRFSRRYSGMSVAKKIAVEEIALKLARIVCGDATYPDHWDDIIGYAVKGRAG